MAFTVTFTSSVLVGGSVRASGSTLSVDDQTARMLVDLGVATASGLTAQTGAVAANLASRVTDNVYTAGTKNTFAHTATTAGLALAGAAGNPSAAANGELWFNSSNGTLTARAAGMNGSVAAVRAWVNFNGTGTIAIRSGFNVSSITDGGAGIYTVNFTTAMSDANYAAVVSTKDSGGTWSVLRAVAQTASAVAVGMRGTSSYGDTDTIAVAVLR